MGSLVDDCPEAEIWLNETTDAVLATGAYGSVIGGVVWSDVKTEAEATICGDWRAF